MIFKSERHFQIWDYNVSHEQILIRSPESPEISHNIDIIFWGVEYVGIPSSMRGLEMGEPSAEDAATYEGLPGMEAGASTAYVLASGGRKFVVVALGFKILKNSMDIFDSSLEYFAGTAPGRDLGEVLAHSAPLAPAPLVAE